MQTHTTDPAHTDWPVQLVLPGQVAAPEGPVDLQMMYLMHHAFRRDLARFAAAALHTPVTDRTTWRLLAARWALFAEVLHNHHSGEDAGLWPLLMERGGPQDRQTLEAMEGEHAEIDPLLRSCAEGLERLAGHADEAARAALAVRLAATRDALGRHLAHEETDAITIVQRVLTQEDWLALDEEYFKREMTPRYILRVVPWAAHGLPRQDLDRLFAEAGAGFKLVWLATRRRFEAREARTFRYVP
ncbi:MAG: hemerythrin domain-containing protein [Ornithinibacter sp.]